MVTDIGWVDTTWYDDRLHLKALLEVHAECFPAEGWRKRDFRMFADRPGHVIKVIVTDSGAVIGSLLYRNKAQRVVIDRLAVVPAARRQHIGTLALLGLIGPYSRNHRAIYTAKAREHNVGAHLFLRKLGFELFHIERAAADCTVAVTMDTPAGKTEPLDEKEDIYNFRFVKVPARRRREHEAAAAVMA